MDVQVFRKTIQPTRIPAVINVLNPEYRSPAPNFYATSMDTVTSNDPRLYDARRGIQIQLNDPPNESNVKPFGNIYGSNPHAPKNAGDFYQTYKDINTGQIRYFVSKAVAPPFFYPLYADKGNAVAYEFTDPNTTTKPQYVKIPQVITNPTTNPNGIPRKTLSFLEDTTAHRDDILMHQMNVRNSQKWAAKNWKSN